MSLNWKVSISGCLKRSHEFPPSNVLMTVLLVPLIQTVSSDKMEIPIKRASVPDGCSSMENEMGLLFSWQDHKTNRPMRKAMGTNNVGYFLNVGIKRLSETGLVFYR